VRSQSLERKLNPLRSKPLRRPELHNGNPLQLHKIIRPLRGRRRNRVVHNQIQLQPPQALKEAENKIVLVTKAEDRAVEVVKIARGTLIKEVIAVVITETMDVKITTGATGIGIEIGVVLTEDQMITRCQRRCQM
jgi:hypothetical protein